MTNFLILFLLSFAFLSAKEQEAPYLTSESDKNSQDKSITRYTYSKDNNLILTENQNNEVEYAYSYHPGTTLLASKLTRASKNILEMEFYSYDKNGILICKIVDDGCTPGKDNLEQVSYRLITEIEPQLNPKLPGMTLPHFIREMYHDPNTDKKQLLKKIERLYTQGDLLAEEKVFDATDTYLYSQTYKYNNIRELISETNALGETTIYAYGETVTKDANGKEWPIVVSFASPRLSVDYYYDYARNYVGFVFARKSFDT
jgi:hypothetical protein